MNLRQLAKFTKAGYIAVNQSEDGQYSLDAIQRLRGGGPILAGILYGATKGLCYGIGIATAAPGIAAGTAGVAVSVATGSAGPVAGGVAAFIGFGPTAIAGGATTLGGVATATGSGLGILATIEALSNAAFLAGMAAPTP